MKAEFSRRWSLNTAGATVVPCATEVEPGRKAIEQRLKTRTELDLEDNLVVGYCGSVMPWQKIPATLEFFRRISSLQPKARFLAITTSPEAMWSEIAAAGLRNVSRVVSTSHEEVPRYLAAADVGLLLRDSSIVNRVASPVKFAEYLACGVPVIITDSVGDYPEIVESQRIGLVIKSAESSHESDLALQEFLWALTDSAEQIRERAFRTAATQFTWTAMTDRLLSVYARKSRTSALAGGDWAAELPMCEGTGR